MKTSAFDCKAIDAANSRLLLLHHYYILNCLIRESANVACRTVNWNFNLVVPF